MSNIIYPLGVDKKVGVTVHSVTSNLHKSI